MDPRLPQLMRVAELAQERETAALAALQRRIAELQQAYHCAGDLPEGDLTGAGFAQSGGLRLWQRRAMQRRVEINTELAQLRAELPARQAAARRAIGRCIALERLRARSLAARR